MPIDARIPLQGVQPEPLMNTFAKMQAIRGAQQENAMRQAQMDEYQRKLQDQNALRATLAGFTPDMTAEQQVSALQRGGHLAEARLLAESSAKTAADKRAEEKAWLEAEQTRMGLRAQVYGDVVRNPTLESAQFALEYLIDNKLVDPAKANVTWKQIQDNPTPDNIRTLASRFQTMSISAKDQLEQHYVEQDYGGGERIVTMPKYGTGAARVVEGSDVRTTLKPGEAERDAETRRHNLAMEAKAAAGEKPMTEFQRQKLQTDKAKDRAMYRAASDTANSLESIADELLGNPEKKIAPHKGLEGMTGASGKIYSFPGGDAAKAEQRYETFKGKVMALGRQIASESGKLGNMAVQEWKFVTDAVEKLDPTAGNFDQQLRSVVSEARLRLDNISSRYEDQYGEPLDLAAAPAARSPEDAEALKWANANPKDPRAAQIKQRLGVR